MPNRLTSDFITELFPTFAKALHLGGPRPGTDLAHAAKGITFAPNQGTGLAWGNSFQPGSNRNYAAEVGELWKNSTVFACLNWIRRTFPEAPLAVSEIGSDELDHEHPLAALIRRPNPAYGRTTLWAATALSYVVDGNAYWFKVRDGAGRVVELWYRPHWTVQPVRASSGNFIDYYLYTVAGKQQKIKPSEVVHLRNGIDPDNEMKGLSDLAALLRVVDTENGSQNVTNSLIRNWGIPGATIMPKDGTPAPTREQATDIHRSFTERTTGDRMGSPIFLNGQYDISYPDVNLDGAALTAVRKLTQSDITAAIGLPAVVVGLLVGLETATAKASHEDARKQAYQSLLMPMQTSISEDIDLHLMPDFDTSGKVETAFDYKGITALNESQDDLVKRWSGLYQTGVAMRSEARAKVGLEVRPEDDIFVLAARELLVDENGHPLETATPPPVTPGQPALTPNGVKPMTNGNGKVPAALRNGNGKH